ncbi:MAG: hypothetical protein SFU53_03645 [Terrimicrobiaceae bacterium]|nr:hypothetical protein [Terrimicrobiaceae bacterium]
MKRVDPLRASRIVVQAMEPVFGENYRPGFLGFLCQNAVHPSRGIAYFTGWSRMSDVAVTGVLIVTGDNEGVEVAGGREVVVTPLSKYFEDPKTQIFFRKPKKCAGGVGERIAEAAKAQVGLRVDQIVRAARVLEGTFARRWVLSHFRSSGEQFSAKFAGRDPGWLGAELAAYCLDAQPEYADRGILGHPPHAIDPQRLFEDDELFAAWSQDPLEGPKGVG